MAWGASAAEFAVMHRFWDEGRFTVTGLEPFKAAYRTRPIHARSCVHTGNWETFSPVFPEGGDQAQFDHPAAETARLSASLCRLVRETFDVTVIEPDTGAVRTAIRILRTNGVVSMFPDVRRGTG